MGQITYNPPIVEIRDCRYGGSFAFDGHQLPRPYRWEVQIDARCERDTILWIFKSGCKRPRVTVLPATTEYVDVRTGLPDRHFVFAVGVTRSDDLGDNCVVLTFEWMMWEYLSTDPIKPIMAKVDANGFFIGQTHGQAVTVPNLSGSFQVEVCCEETKDDHGDTVCRPKCKLLNQLP